LRLSHEQYERIIGLVGRGSSSTRPEPGEIQDTINAAARIARKGRLQDAERMITGLPVDGPLGPATLDLKARICAQQGRLLEAQFCWMEAVHQSPGNESYRRSLDYVTRTLRPSRFPVIVYLVIMALCALIGATATSVLGLGK